MPKPLQNWYKRDDGRYTHLTEDDYLFVLTSIGDGWVWSCWHLKHEQEQEPRSVSPNFRTVKATPRDCVHEARQWYEEFIQQQHQAKVLKRIVKLD